MNQIVTRKRDGGLALHLILEPGNVYALQHARPISIRIEDMFPDGIPRKLELNIYYSETPVADARALAKVSDVALDMRQPVAQAMRPHCPECRSTIEQQGVLRGDESPIATVYCPQCGCVLGVMPKEALATVEGGVRFGDAP